MTVPKVGVLVAAFVGACGFSFADETGYSDEFVSTDDASVRRIDVDENEIVYVFTNATIPEVTVTLQKNLQLQRTLVVGGGGGGGGYSVAKPGGAGGAGTVILRFSKKLDGFFALTTSVTGSGEMTVDGAAPEEGAQYPAGAQVRLVATPQSGFCFGYWSGLDEAIVEGNKTSTEVVVELLRDSAVSVGLQSSELVGICYNTRHEDDCRECQ